ncbi:Putative 115 kDa protein in type-1 retrotransposable element R1DM [Eumeta japonica]|uniref:115 kDa protein in type-1 retrotransposable element R1DM n=1 Tax=Eumeta variegata TaxID=151549 RepID=A0A4C1TY03_EUMVA|nr:Putative 115 kDa protein in type-1 retrotransposable element R1DM [Eumeta japonica]
MGKTVERMLVWRIQCHIMPKLQTRQYGFMPQRGTEDSFNKEPTARSQMPGEPPRHGDGLPTRPEVVVRYTGGEFRKETSKGCIQGSIAGPTFWNLVLDSLLRELGDLGVYVQAFADDVVLMFSGQSASALEAETNRALAHVRDSLTIDKRLTFTPYVAKACKKAANIYKGIARVAKATWVMSPEIVRTIYVAVIEPIVMYASCAWAPATKNSACGRCWARYSTVELGDICADRELERPVDFRELPHPAHTLEFGFESVEDLDSSTVDRLAIVGPHILTVVKSKVKSVRP